MVSKNRLEKGKHGQEGKNSRGKEGQDHVNENERITVGTVGKSIQTTASLKSQTRQGNPFPDDDEQFHEQRQEEVLPADEIA